MKNIKTATFIAIFAVLLIACGQSDNSDLSKKKEELNKLKQERTELSNKIKELENEIEKLDSGSAGNSKSALVKTEKIEISLFKNQIEVMGKIDADLNTNVSCEIPGKIQRIYVREGQRITVGQTLGDLDNTVSEVALNEVKTQLEFAKTVYLKQKNLWDQEIGTEIQYLTAKNNYEGLQKRLATMNQQLGMANIKSPINGVVDEVYIKTGQSVAPGVPCFRVVNTNQLKVKAQIAESFAGKIHIGDKVSLSFPDINKTIEGKISYASKVIDPLNRTFFVEIPIAFNEDYKPNMLAKINIIDYTNENAIVVPINTVRTIGNEQFVMISTKNGNKNVAKRQKVSIGKIYNGMAEVVTGLSVGDALITIGYQELEDGDELKL
ncbi:MAG: efflux RND transporter periplasmic adaptor subunit [Flavobacteriales bacterium]|nr:efflux RND transporter periplasmic adaptor subunit [Flavobacteriales bacterium]